MSQLRNYRILNLGIGVQSSAIYCLGMEGEPAAQFDFAPVADTQDEPSWVYDQLEWLRSLNGPPIIVVSAGCVGDDLSKGRNSTGQRFASIPAFTTFTEGVKGGLTRRQCTREYKIDPIDRWIRRDLLKLKPRQRIPQDVRITNMFGFSTDEAGRAQKMRLQFAERSIQWNCEFPLFDDELMMSRRDCQSYIDEKAGFRFRSSRCVFCPLQQNRHWRELRDHDPRGWDRAVDVDAQLRTEGSVANRDMNEIMYVHRHHRPLAIVNLGDDQSQLFEDDGGCDQGCFT